MANGDKFRYRRQIVRHGEPVTLRRYTGRNPTDYIVKGWVKGFYLKGLFGVIYGSYGERQVLILAEDVAGVVPLPITVADYLVVRDQECEISSIDDNTYRDRGELFAYELKVTG